MQIPWESVVAAVSDKPDSDLVAIRRLHVLTSSPFRAEILSGPLPQPVIGDSQILFGLEGTSGL